MLKVSRTSATLRGLSVEHGWYSKLFLVGAMFHYTLIERYLEDTSKILGDFFVLSGKAKLNAAFDELSHYDLKDPNGFAEFLITANIGLVRAKFPGCFQFQKRTTRSITVFLSICVHFKQMVIGCDQILFSVGRSRSRFKHLILNDFDSFTSHHPNEFQCQVRNFE